MLEIWPGSAQAKEGSGEDKAEELPASVEESIGESEKEAAPSSSPEEFIIEMHFSSSIKHADHVRRSRQAPRGTRMAKAKSFAAPPALGRKSLLKKKACWSPRISSLLIDMTGLKAAGGRGRASIMLRVHI